MYKIIPFYGKTGTIKSIKELSNNYFEISTYKEDGTVNTYNTAIEKEQVLKNYLDDVIGYLDTHKNNYKDIKHVVDNDLVTKASKKILGISLASLALIPFITLLVKPVYLFGASVLSAILTMPPIAYSLLEITKKVSINDMRNSIKEYDDLTEEKEKMTKELEDMQARNVTRYSPIKPKKVETENKEKKLVKETK